MISRTTTCIINDFKHSLVISVCTRRDVYIYHILRCTDFIKIIKYYYHSVLKYRLKVLILIL